MDRIRKLSQTRQKKRWTTLCLAVVTAVSIMGCSNPTGGGEMTEKSVLLGNEGEGVNDTVAMGRYVETVTEVDAGSVMDIRELSDGSLVLLEDGAVGRMISVDGGVTWKEDILPGWYELLEAEEEVTAPQMGVYLISPTGKMQWAQIDLEEEESLASVCFSEDGSRLFAALEDGKIYEIDKDTGKSILFMTVDMAPDAFCVWENYMAIRNEGGGVLLYDMNTTERIVDDVLSEFVALNCKGSNNTLLFTYAIFPSEEGGLYLACDKGVYRHVIGGAVMEQVINGGLSSFSDPTGHISKMIRFGEDGFLAAFSEGKISSFTYDPNISTTPSRKLTAYSLTESTILRQAIIRYQGKHPDVYVEYKVGMDEEGGASREDAVKKLNAEIMAGKGPDFLILDGLPVDSYLQKGVLADLSPYLTELEGEEKILPNIKESFTEGDKICMIPAAITLSMYITDQKNMTDVSELSDFADMLERMRSEHPGEEIAEVYSEEMLLDTLMPVAAPLWFTESGQLDTKQLSEDLEQVKRIYDACMEGLSEEVLEKYYMRAQQESVIVSSSEVSAYNNLQGGGIQIAAGGVQVSMGTLQNAYNYAFIQSLKKIENVENRQAVILPGGVKDSFSPLALMGISTVCGNSNLAGGLLKEVLSSEMQSMIYPIGFPINEEGLSAYLESLGGMVPKDRRTPGEAFGGFGFSSQDGEIITLTLYMPTGQERKELYDMLASVHTPYLIDVVVEEAVREAVKPYLGGRCSLEEAVGMIQKKIEIYMAE